MMQRRFFTHLTLCAPAFLAACSNPPAQLKPLAGQQYWSGRISIQVHDNPPQSTSGSFELSGTTDTGELVLLNPLGNIVARIQWSPNQATLTQGQHSKQAPSLDALTQELVGTPLPVVALFDWLQGRTTQAAGWISDLSAYADGKILAQRTAPLPAANLRIVLDNAR